MVPDTLVRVPEMMDTPPIQNNYAFIIIVAVLHVFGYQNNNGTSPYKTILNIPTTTR